MKIADFGPSMAKDREVILLRILADSCCPRCATTLCGLLNVSRAEDRPIFTSVTPGGFRHRCQQGELCSHREGMTGSLWGLLILKSDGHEVACRSIEPSGGGRKRIGRFEGMLQKTGHRVPLKQGARVC